MFKMADLQRVDMGIAMCHFELTCNELGIKGKEATPYLLGKIVELTDGNSLKANIELVYNNCRLASKISVNLNLLRRK